MIRLRSLFRRPTDRDLDDELRTFVEERTRAHIALGASPEQARRAALLEVGGPETVKEDTRQVHPWHHMEIFWRDIRFGARALWRARGFAAVVIATLALGVGASVTMFTIMHAVMWRALPYPDSDRLVVIDSRLGSVQGDGMPSGEMQNLRAWSHDFTGFAMANGAEAFLTIGDEMERVSSASVTDDMLGLLGGVPLQFGRPLDAAIDIRDETVTSVVISHRLWQRLFHGDPGVIGRRVDINNRDREVVGVLPSRLRVWLPSVTGVDEEVDVWFPTPLESSFADFRRPAIAKLRPGVTLAQGQAELDALAPRLMAAHPEWYKNGLGDSVLRLRARFLADVVAAPAARGLTALGAAVAFVLLIACVNVTNLMLARGRAREREIAVRTALGASRLRVVRQLLTEDLVLAGAGAVAGLAVARGGVLLVEWLRPLHLPRQSEVAIDPMIALVTIGVSIVATLAAGLVPALKFAGGPAASPLMSLRAAVSVAGGRRLQRVLVIAEVALSIVPLVAAGLMLRTFDNLSRTPLGFEPANILTARMSYSYLKFPDLASTWALHRDAVRAVSQLPGIEGASAASPLPFDPVQDVRRFRRDDPSDQGFAASQQAVLPGYLKLVGIPLVSGRDLTEDDVTARRDVAIVDERFADVLWNGPAMGQRIRVGSGQYLRVLEVVGVTRPLRMRRVRDEPLPHVFVPYHLSPRSMTLVVKTHGEPTTVGPLVKRAVEALGTARAVWGIRPMSAYVAESVNEARFTMQLLLCFAALSLLLAAVGLYGTLAYLISQRTQEFGVRLALGASTRQIVSLVASEGALLTATGAAFGVAGALAVARTLGNLLYGVTPLDSVTLAGVALVVALVSVAAVSQPAWRASRVDPNVALRADS